GFAAQLPKEGIRGKAVLCLNCKDAGFDFKQDQLRSLNKAQIECFVAVGESWCYQVLSPPLVGLRKKPMGVAFDHAGPVSQEVVSATRCFMQSPVQGWTGFV